MRPAILSLALAAALGLAATACEESPVQPALDPEPGVAASRFGAHGYDYTVVDVPNALWTQVYRLNARRDLVGTYRDATGTHGFVRRHGEFQPIDVAGATATQGRGINDRGDIVGFYTLAGQLRGYLLHRGEVTTIDFPAAVGTRLWDISDRGEISGEYQATAGGAWRAFTWRRGGFSALDVPDATMSAGYGINTRGAVVGHYTLPGSKMFGFVFRHGTYTQLDHPDSGNLMSCAMGIGEHGEVLGHYGNPTDNIVYGFVWHRGEFVTALRVPDAAQTYPTSITRAGMIAGYHMDPAGVSHGFLAVPARP
jgi:uncharacterized membrane protein